MTTESKKLQTTYTGRLTPDPYGIVQEQREVIRQLLGMVRDLDPEGWHYLECVKKASTFLQD